MPDGDTRRGVYSSFRRGSVVLPGADKMLFSLSGPGGVRFWTEAQRRFAFRICYCSLYRECWVGDSEADEPVPVAACGITPADTLWQN